MNGERWRTLAHERSTVRDVGPWTVFCIKQIFIKESRCGYGMVNETSEDQEVYCDILRHLKISQKMPRILNPDSDFYKFVSNFEISR